MIRDARKTESSRLAAEKRLAEHRYDMMRGPAAPPPQLPVLLSLLGMQSGARANEDTSMSPFGLLLPALAMSLHRPLAGALPSADTLRRRFDALRNAESKIYLYEGPDHRGIHPPTDQLSIFTYCWGFELALPPPTLEYLGKAKTISQSLLNLLGVIVYAVPGGTRESAPFVGVFSRFIETE